MGECPQISCICGRVIRHLVHLKHIRSFVPLLMSPLVVCSAFSPRGLSTWVLSPRRGFCCSAHLVQVKPCVPEPWPTAPMPASSGSSAQSWSRNTWERWVTLVEGEVAHRHWSWVSLEFPPIMVRVRGWEADPRSVYRVNFNPELVTIKLYLNRFENSGWWRINSGMWSWIGVSLPCSLYLFLFLRVPEWCGSFSRWPEPRRHVSSSSMKLTLLEVST